MRATVGYVLAALALGGIGYCGSEALFWSFPPEGVTLLDWALTIVAYALAGACALSAVVWSGLHGWQAVFLGGAVLGFVVEGVIVSTMYDAFPVQLVWTPLAWHAVVTGLAIFGLHLHLLTASPLRHALAMLAVGAGGGFFACYWPMERPMLPPVSQILIYQLGSGLAAALGFVLLGRIGRLPRPPVAVLALVPVLAVILWIIQGIADPRPQRLALPVMMGVTLWAMRRLGGDPARLVFPSAPLLRQAMFLICPLVTALVAAFLVRGTGGFAANIIALLILAPVGLGLWLWSLWKARLAGSGPAPVSG